MDLTVSDPAALGFDPGRLARIDDFITERYLDTGRFPGFSLLISRRGEIAHLSAQGKRNLETGAPMTPDTIVRIYSMSKPITSVALLSLYEEGHFRLDDPVSRFIPSFSDLRVWSDGNPVSYTTTFPEREMTIRDLFTHTSGLTYGFMQRHPVDALYRRSGLDEDIKLEDWVEILAGLPLLFSPGSQWSYSVATDVLGRLVEVVSGLPFDQFLTERIFAPPRHARHLVPGRRRAGRPLRRLLHPALPVAVPPSRRGQRRWHGRGRRRRPQQHLPSPPLLPVGGRWSHLDHRRLPPLHPDAARGR